MLKFGLVVQRIEHSFPKRVMAVRFCPRPQTKPLIAMLSGVFDLIGNNIGATLLSVNSFLNY